MRAMPETRSLGPSAVAAGRPLLPRLSIHAFCEDDGTAQLLSAAASDRHLAKSHLASQMGGIAAACAAYDKAPTPNLLIVESLLDGQGMLAELERLALVCQAETKVLVVGHVNDVLLYRDLMRKGVSDYLVPPFTPATAADCIAAIFASASPPAPGRVIAFMSAKGGAGSSTICHNVAWALAETVASDTIIADLDIAFGTLGLNFNQDSPQGVPEALAAADRLDQVMAAKLLSKCSERLSLMGASSSLAQSAEISAEPAARLIEILSQMAAHVALDLPRQWTPWLRRIVLEADDIVITAEPDLANLRNAKNLLDTIAAARVKDRPPLLVLNKVNIPRRPEIQARDFANAVDMAPAAIIEFDPSLFGTAANNGLMAGEVSRKAKASEQFRNLAAALARKSAAPAEGDGLFAPILNRLMRKTAG